MGGMLAGMIAAQQVTHPRHKSVKPHVKQDSFIRY
jgi:hypothetical protein